MSLVAAFYLTLGTYFKCDDCGNNATLFCEKCDVNFCSNCSIQTLHSKPAYKNHPVFPVVEVKRKSNICAKHNKEQELFCVVDESLVCVLCPFAEHKGHECVVLAEYINKEKQEVVKSSNELQVRAKKLEDACQVIQSEIAKVKSVR